MTEWFILQNKMITNTDQINLSGYSVHPVPMSEILWLNKYVHVSFYLKVYDNPLKYSAIVDVDFFSSNKPEIAEKETAKSFVSIVLKNKDILLFFKDFEHNHVFEHKLLRYDDEWHRFDIKIFKDNLWCPNKRCKFETCAHPEAKSLGDIYLSWNPKDIKRHRRVSISIDGSKEIYLNSMDTNSQFAMISFSNNSLGKTKDIVLVNQIIESSLTNRPSISIKGINAVYDEDEITFVLKNHITPPPAIDIHL